MASSSEQTDICRQVCFTLWTSKLPVSHVFAKIFYEENSPNAFKSIKCQSKTTADDGIIWEATASDLPTCKLWYKYELDVTNDDTTTRVEEEFRQILPEHRYLCDTLTNSECNLSPNDVLAGTLYNLQCFIDCFIESSILKTVLSDLEHMWMCACGSKLFTHSNVEDIRKWAEKQLGTYSEERNRHSKKFTFAAVVLGFICSYIENDKITTTSMSENTLRRIQDSLATISKLDLTPWAVCHLRATGIVVLRSLGELHWMAIVAHLGNLYSNVELLQMQSKAICEHKITVANVMNCLIPRIILLGNSQQVLEAVLQKIPSLDGFDDDEKQQLSEIVKKNMMPMSLLASSSTKSRASQMLSVELQTVNFRLWTGYMTVKNVQLTICENSPNGLNVIQNIECHRDTGEKKSWQATADLSTSSTLSYNYNLDIEQNGFDVNVEGHLRTLVPQNKFLCDILTSEEHQISQEDIFDGLEYHLHTLLGDKCEFHSTITSLSDLEHMWSNISNILTHDVVTFVKGWCERKMFIYLEGENTENIVLFLTIVYVVISQCFSEYSAIPIQISKLQLQKLQKTIAKVKDEDVTPWAIPYLKKAKELYLNLTEDDIDDETKAGATEEVLMSFRLCYHKDDEYKEANLYVRNKGKYKQKQIKCHVLVSGNNWNLVGIDEKVAVNQDLEYQYGLTYKSPPIVFSAENREKTWRSLTTKSDAYDVFHSQSLFSKHNFPCENCSYGSFFHVKAILSTVNEKGLKCTILAADRSGFPSRDVDKNFVSEFTSWMENELDNQQLTDALSTQKVVFIALLVAKVMNAAKCHVDPKQFKPATLDKISKALSSCNMGDLPSATLDNDVEMICRRTVQGLNETFIYLWQNFSNILSVSKLEKMSNSWTLLWITTNSSDNTKHALASALTDLLDKPSYSTSLIMRTVKEIKDVDVLLDLLQVATINPSITKDPDVDTVVTHKFEALLFNLEAKKKDLFSLGSYWAAVININIAGLIDAVRNLIVAFLRTGTWSIANKNLKSLILDPRVLSKVDFVYVMKILLKLKTQCNQVYPPQKLFLEIMEEPEFWKSLEPNEIKNLLEIAIQSISSVSCECRKPHLEDMIRTALQMQQVVNSNWHLKSAKSRVESSIQKTLKTISLWHLFCIEFLDKAKCTQFPEISLLNEHICHRLIQEGDSIKKHSNELKNVLYGRDEGWTKTIDSEYLADVLETMIDVTCRRIFKRDQTKQINADEMHDFESCFKMVLEHGELLLIVLDIQPNSKYNFLQHSGLQAVKKMLKQLPERLNRGDITITLFDQICEDQIVLDMIHTLGYPSSGEWQTARKKAKKLRATFENYISSFESLTHGTIRYVLETINVMDVEDILEEVKIRSEHFCHPDKPKLSEANNPMYWGTLHPLLKEVAALRPVAYSEIFLNISRLHFTTDDPLAREKTSETASPIGFDHSDLHVDEDEAKPNYMSYAEFVKILFNKCLVKYQLYGQMLATQGLSVPVTEVQDVLDGIENEENMGNELNLLSKLCCHDLSGIVKPVMSLIKLPDIKQKAQQLTSVFETFELEDNKHPIRAALCTIKQLSKREIFATLTLPEVDNAVSEIISKTMEISEVGWDIISQLTKGKELINFLRTILDEDLRNLIDAVEERSDQNVDEYTVSALIDVKRHLTPLLRLQPSNQPEKLIHAIVQVMNTVDNGDTFCTKINTCVHNVYGLKDLFNNVANRGEMTREKIRNALQEGIYEFEMDSADGTWKAQMTYQRGEKCVTYGLDELNDLQSRALLIVHSQRQHQQFQHHQDSTCDEEDETRPVDYDIFIKDINAVNKIVKICISLIAAGHFEFRNFRACTGNGKTLQNILTYLQESSDKWQQDIDDARTKFYVLNFFQSKQLGYLEQFYALKSDVTYEILLLFRFLNPNIVVDLNLRDRYTTPGGVNVQKRLLHLGQALDNIMKAHTTFQREIPSTTQNTLHREIPSTVSHTESKVTPGIVFVAELEIRSSKALHVLMQLYKNTSGFLPEPSQVLFCNSNTTWEEVYLLLERCKGAPEHFPDRKLLYAIVHADQLQTETQLKLITEVKKLHDNNTRFLLAIICCGGRYHHIVDQFSPHYTHILSGFDGAELQACFEECWKDMPTCRTLQSNAYVTNVTFLTSTQPGLGKTESVKRMASIVRCGVNTVLVAGPITKQSLIKQLKSQSTRKHCILHLDCSEMTNSDIFDCFVFEMAVVGMSVSGTSMCISPSPVVILEIANTQRGHLQNSLPICSAFPNKHLHWTGFDDYVVSEDTNSHVQVVCHYLKALNDKTLDKRDINFVGPKKISPLSESECRTILKQHFSSDTVLSYSLIETFLGLFSQELRRMSASSFFTSANLDGMVENKYRKKLKRHFVHEMMTVCKTFSARSIDISQTRPIISHTAAQIAESRLTTGVSSESVVERMNDMIMWHDTNHLFFVFHRQDSQTVTPVYQNKSKLPGDIKHLFQTQMNGLDKPLPDYNDMSHAELQRELEKIVRTNSLPFDKTKLKELQTGYALTPDNFLKMVLIYIRIQAQIPVIIMGETGCGKTSLVMYLARVCEVPFQKLNLHTGVTEDVIVDFIDEVKRSACQTEHTWVFFDEINTCDHIGLMNEIICHHRCKGEYLPPNLVFVAACNPYRLRKDVNYSAGLESRTDKTRDEISKLVYRVHPLPETMMEYVWDYGALNEKDEEIYIKQMFGKQKEAFVNLVVESQRFMRKHEGNSHCVSLRDVNRCKHLQHHFQEMFNSKKLVLIPGSNDGDFINRRDIRSIVLALCHCYHSRLSIAKDRKAYRQIIGTNLARANGFNEDKINEKHIDRMIEFEQMDLLKRMTQRPPGTAMNEALRENVFVMLVSILNNIPVFVVGKPGCSKSLAMQLIKSNLRGADSSDEYFKTLPPIYTISFQGSKSSTSEGIIKVFEKAKRYKDHNPNVIPVVLLDEIGLAELSAVNPLKVLHSQLEPIVGEFPPVAVVGISNWALDPAKMNRAVHLSRPDPTELDLQKTAESIRDSVKCGSKPTITDAHIKGLAKAYYEYQHSQIDRHFHGLRDYYSFIKVISSVSGKDPADVVINGLRRNFGGMKSDITNVLNTFLGKAKLTSQASNKPDVRNLITDNINDLDARHLLLITRGDSALNILEQTLQRREHKIIYGSNFENDRTEQYKYHVLSEIILCMERGLVLVMRDLDCIYESLYDMLNQSYTVVGRKRNCRVAIGAYSNPMCQVHKKFRCIVMVDEKKLDLTDPPFLNRFEKQPLTFSEVLTNSNENMVCTLRRWIDDLNTEENPCDTDEIFLGFSTDSLSSLVYKLSVTNGDKEDKTQEIDQVKECKRDLLKTASPDAILRLPKSKLSKYDVAEIQRIYFSLPIHDGFYHFLQEHDRLCGNTKVIVYTHSSIHIDLKECIHDLPVQFDKLSNFKSKLDLSNRLLQFWNQDSKASLLVVQCMPCLDASNMTLAKCCIDEIQREYLKKNSGNPRKSVCIVVHLDRFQNRNQDNSWRFNFLCGWDQFTIDSLDSTTPVLRDIYENDISEVLDMEDLEWKRIVDAKMLLWCFNCINYIENTRSVDNTLQLVYLILQSKEVMEVFKAQVLKYLKDEDLSQSSTETWQMEIAFDREKLMTWSTLVRAMLEHVRHRIRLPLAKVIIALEESNAWTGICVDLGNHLKLIPGNQETHTYWKVCLQESEISNMLHQSTNDPRGSETYPLVRSVLDLKYPCFNIFKRVMDTHYQSLMKGTFLYTNTSTEDGDKDYIQLQLCNLISRIPKINHDGFLTKHLDKFIDDLLNVFSETFTPNIDADLRVEILRCLLNYTKHLGYSDATTDPFQTISEVYLIIQRNHQLLSAELLMISEYNKTGRDVKRLLEGLGSSQNEVDSKDMLDQSQTKSYQLSLETDDKVSRTSKDLSAMINIDDNSISDGHNGGNYDKNLTTKDTIHANLVTEVCKAHLPFKETLDYFGGIERWQQTTNSVLNLAKQITLRTSILTDDEMSSKTSIFHFLNLCRDFATLLLSMKLTNQDTLLSSLADLSLRTDFIDVLDNKEIVEYLADVTRSSEKIHVPVIKRQEFMSMCFNLCLQANLDTPLLIYILKTLCLESGNIMKGSRPVLHNILEGDIDANICEDIISIGTIDEENYPNIYAVGEILKSVAMESPFSVTCCDIIEDEALSQITWEHIQDIRSRDDHVLKMATKSTEIVFGTESAEDARDAKSSMQYVCAGAFLRAFIKCVGEFFHYTEDHQLFQQQEKHHVLGTSVCNILSHASQRSNPSILSVYLLKCMAGPKTLFEVCEWLKEVPQSLQYLRELDFQPQLRTSRLGYNPLSYLPNYSKVMNALSEWLEDGKTGKLTAVLQIANQDTECQFGIVSAFSDEFYWGQTTTEIRSTNQMKMGWLKAKINETFSDPPYLCLLYRLLAIGSQNDFFDISHTTDIRKLHQISLVLHVACLLISRDSQVSLDGVVDSQILDSQSHDSVVSIAHSDCQCGFSMFGKEMQTTCTLCHRDLRDVKTVQSDTTTALPKPISMIQMILNVIKNSFCIGRLLFCNSGKDHDTLGNGTSKPVSSATPTTATTKPVSSATPTTATTEDDPIQTKYKPELEENWLSLADMLDMNLTDVSLLLHSVLYNIIKAKPTRTLPFQELVRTIVEEILLDSNKYMKEYKHICFAAQDVKVDSIEYQVEELPCPQIERFHALKPQLFRKRRCPTFQDFEMQVFQMTSGSPDFPFLQLFLRFKELLQYVRHLPILMKWTAAISRQLRHSVHRVQAEEIEISTLLKESQSWRRLGETTSDIFDDFQKAWNDISGGWGVISGSDKELPTMTVVTPIIMCVMNTGEDKSPLYRIVRALQNIQNEFLQNTLSIASSVYSPSLNFLVKEGGVSTIQRVALDQARSEIIDFQWFNNNDMNKVLYNCDNDTDYGKGYSLRYNFMVIERTLARLLVIGKTLLTDGTVFSQTVFSDDLTHAPSLVLADVSSKILQEDLSKDVLESLHRKISNRKKFVTELLENLEIMFVLLKKTGGEPHELLVHYIELWSRQLPGSFSSDFLPELSSIRLCHIRALYNELEGQLADDYVNYLESRFKLKLQKHMIDAIKQSLKGLDVDQMQSAVRLLRLFTFRYLRPCKNVISATCDTSLVDVVRRRTRGTMDVNAVIKLIPDDVCVRHIFKLQELIEMEMQNKKGSAHQQHRPNWESTREQGASKLGSTGRNQTAKKKGRRVAKIQT